MSVNGNGKRYRRVMKKRPHRPTTLTESVTTRILANISKVYFLSPAAEAAGVPATTAREWYQRGCADDAPEPYATFAWKVSQVQAETEVYLAGVMKKAAATEWTAAARILEAVNERWARQDRTRIDQNVTITLDEGAIRALVKVVLESLITRGVDRAVIALVAKDLDESNWKQLALPSMTATRPADGERS